MKSEDYLYDILKRSPIEGYIIGRKRYTIATSKIGGKWKYEVCSCFRDRLTIISDFYDSPTDAWEAFLGVQYPKVLDKWKKREYECE